MDLEKLQELIRILKENNLAEIELDGEEGYIRVRDKEVQAIYGQLPVAQPQLVSEMRGEGESQGETTDNGLVKIKAPMVGTFYRAPAPDAEPYVREGDTIEVGQILCIIEAMKLMNEIKSEVAGVIEKILVENAQPVEYGQVLFLVRPK